MWRSERAERAKNFRMLRYTYDSEELKGTRVPVYTPLKANGGKALHQRASIAPSAGLTTVDLLRT